MDEQTVKLLRLQTRRIGLAHHLARLARSIRYTEDAGVSKPAKPAPCSSVNAVQDEASEHHEVATYSWATCKHFILLAETEQQHTGCMTASELQQLLGDCGIYLTVLHAHAALQHMLQVDQLMTSILQNVDGRQTGAELQDKQSMSSDGKHAQPQNLRGRTLLGWIFSGRAAPAQLVLDRVCVKAKTAYQRCVRNTTSNIAAMLALLSQDGLLSAQMLGPLRHAEGHAAVQLVVGDESSSSHAAGLSVFAQLLHGQGGPCSDPVRQDCGAAVTIEFEARHDAEEQALQTAIDSLDKALTIFLVPELQRLPHFQHTEVTLSPPGAGGIRTVRIRAIFNKHANLDDVLRRLGIGCRLADIIPELSIDMALRCSLAELLESQTGVLAAQLTGTLGIDCRFARAVFAHILEVVNSAGHLATASRPTASPWWCTRLVNMLKGSSNMKWVLRCPSIIQAFRGNAQAMQSVPSCFRWQNWEEAGAMAAASSKAYKVLAADIQVVRQQFKQLQEQWSLCTTQSTAASTKVRHGSHRAPSVTTVSAIKKLTQETVTVAADDTGADFRREYLEGAAALAACLSACASALLGICSVVLQTGSSSIMIECHGVDLFDCVQQGLQAATQRKQ
eukprot:TRINITY_DN4346_c1_g1_i1.p1 TRINITY_DN4346_c1_g1~~TRINITY_DN4346_c1_g1_i1.p1  ORF type:complete len:627 (+),score=53.92 TRINITY_DN4346_c1_g1_i1:25-1881(+)